MKGIEVYACAVAYGTSKLNVLVPDEQTGLVLGVQDVLFSELVCGAENTKYPPAPTATMTTTMIALARRVETPRCRRQFGIGFASIAVARR